MGLDMTLTKKTSFFNDMDVSINVSKSGVNIPIISSRLYSIEEELICWRKANAIHGWFVRNVQRGVDNCATYYVTQEDLERLVGDISTVLDAKEKDTELSVVNEILPPTKGCFFGHYGIDEYYWESILDTKIKIESVLSELSDNTNSNYYCSIYYMSSW
jgi:hypothetical protein